jgi:hypothetical protein
MCMTFRLQKQNKQGVRGLRTSTKLPFDIPYKPHTMCNSTQYKALKQTASSLKGNVDSDNTSRDCPLVNSLQSQQMLLASKRVFLHIYIYIYIYIILDIIHHPVFYLKHGISVTAFCLRLQVEPAQLDPKDNPETETISIHWTWVGSTWRRRHNPVSETSCFK